MTLRLRPTWPDQSRSDDFEVLEGEEAVGRIVLMYYADGRPRWHWFLYGVATDGWANDVNDLPNGRTDSRDQAVAALKVAWDAVRNR